MSELTDAMRDRFDFIDGLTDPPDMVLVNYDELLALVAEAEQASIAQAKADLNRTLIKWLCDRHNAQAAGKRRGTWFGW
jgi:hypothetical protein